MLLRVIQGQQMMLVSGPVMSLAHHQLTESIGLRRIWLLQFNNKEIAVPAGHSLHLELSLPD